MINLLNYKTKNIEDIDTVYLDIERKLVFHNFSKREVTHIFINDNLNSILKNHNWIRGSIRNYGKRFEKVLDD